MTTKEELKEQIAELTAANAKLTESNAKLSSALDTSTKTNSKLSESLIEAQKTIQLLQTENYELKLKTETSPGPDKLPYHSTYGKPPAYSDIAKMVIKTMGEAEQLKEKSQRAVIEKLPESLDETKFLTDSIKELPENHGIQIEQCHRHGSEKPDRARIIKVQFDSTSSRNNFFRNFRPALNSLINKTIANSEKPPKFLKIRRDMTQTELQEMYASRKFCYEENLKINGRKYYVHDTQVREFNEIKPFAKQG
ncbi:hypothetical protein DdX_21884 [Ditylenchus destructor]|uniref:Uncharacterized protein n=1 Tax=Ditylenchus destructor TaxID=166010 RepID=A0AAD4MFP0_9BILA|nr:hypothetical protein DdX_21884 [Ditylenchus destructor]